MYNFDELVNRKGTDCVKWDSVDDETLPMFIADMDFKVLPEIEEALERKVKQSIYGYTMVSDEYKQTVIDWEKRRYGAHFEKEWLITTPGIVPAIFAAVNVFTNENDGVMIQDPVYFPFKKAITSNNRKVVLNEVNLVDGRYEYDFESLENKIVEEDVKLFILCNPHNPIGRVWTKDELQTLGNICKKHDVKVIADEIHADFIFSGHKHVSFYEVDESFKEFSMVCSAPSKTFNLAGLTASNCFIANEEMRTAFTSFTGRSGMGSVNSFGLISCEAAYKHGDTYVDELCQYIEGNYQLVDSYLKENLPQIKVVKMEGTYLAWLDMNALGLEDEDLEKFCLEEAKVKMNAGASFGDKGKGFMRMNLATPRSNVLEGLKRIEKAIKK